MARINFTEQIVMMEVGEQIEFPSITYDSVSNIIDRTQFKYGRKYKRKRDRKRQCLVVTRIK